MPSKSTNKLCTHAHHGYRSVAAAIFANGTYFVDTPHTSADTNKLKRIQHKFAALRFNRFLLQFD
jgi:hypothetical protein